MTVVARLHFVVFFFASACAVASDHCNEIFENAVDAVEFDKSWAYTETQVDGEHVWVGR